MEARKWLMGIGASSALAVSALVAPLSAAAQDDTVNGTTDPGGNVTTENGFAPIDQGQAVNTALTVMPGEHATNVNLDFAYVVWLPTTVIVDTTDDGTDDVNGAGADNVTLNLVYIVELSNNFNITIDASTGDIITVDVDDDNGENGDDNGDDNGDNGNGANDNGENGNGDDNGENGGDNGNDDDVNGDDNGDDNGENGDDNGDGEDLD